MIVHCRSIMTETSSTHRFWRCLGRCFGIDRHRPTTKTTLESMENGFSCLENEQRSNGNATVVKLCQPSTNGFNKQLQSVGEKACCVLDSENKDELPYSYQPVTSIQSQEVKGSSNATLSGESLANIDAKSANILITSDQPSISNKNIDMEEKLQLSKWNQYQLKTPELLPEEEADNIIAALKRENDRPVVSDLLLVENEQTMKDNMKKSTEKVDIEIKFASDCSGNIDSAVAAESLMVYHSGSMDSDLQPTGNAVVLCNGGISNLKTKDSIPEGQGDLIDKNLVNGGGSSGVEGHGIRYFENMVQSETTRLGGLIQKWEKLLADNREIHDEVQDEIRSTNGQTRLVISERFFQFKSLVEQSEKQANGELVDTKSITLTDLQGFWDMIYFQVEDVLVKFRRLENVKNANWNPALLHENGKKTQPVKKLKRPANARTKKTYKTATSKSSNISEEEKARRLAARKRLADARKKMAAQERPRSTSDESFIVQ